MHKYLFLSLFLMNSAFAVDSTEVNLLPPKRTDKTAPYYYLPNSPFVLFTQDNVSFSADTTFGGCNGQAETLSNLFPHNVPGKDSLTCPPNFSYIEQVDVKLISTIQTGCYLVDTNSKVTKANATAPWVVSGFLRYQCLSGNTFYCVPAKATVTVICVPS